MTSFSWWSPRRGHVFQSGWSLRKATRISQSHCRWTHPVLTQLWQISTVHRSAGVLLSIAPCLAYWPSTFLDYRERNSRCYVYAPNLLMYNWVVSVIAAFRVLWESIWMATSSYPQHIWILGIITDDPGCLPPNSLAYLMAENHSHVVLSQTVAHKNGPNFPQIFWHTLFPVSARIIFRFLPFSLQIYGVEETAPFPCALNAGIMGANAKVPCFAGDCGPLACILGQWLSKKICTP